MNECVSEPLTNLRIFNYFGDIQDETEEKATRNIAMEPNSLLVVIPSKEDTRSSITLNVIIKHSTSEVTYIYIFLFFRTSDDTSNKDSENARPSIQIGYENTFLCSLISKL
ncbi:LOW QUALITY PROTEIN: hypothetical protein V1477_005753 [Vespula maculifrons]|uniref:Uncharacterized protein n=1 Tax=Vespula maculifrons TaxID=7453 RepID=A0ABD2CLX6_VESMC